MTALNKLIILKNRHTAISRNSFGNQLFFKLDLSEAYRQIPADEKFAGVLYYQHI